MRAFRADQILQSLYRDYIGVWDEATTLPKDFREDLKREFPITAAEVLDVSESSDGTKKLLVGFEDGNSVETVLIPATGPAFSGTVPPGRRTARATRPKE